MRGQAKIFVHYGENAAGGIFVILNENYAINLCKNTGRFKRPVNSYTLYYT